MSDPFDTLRNASPALSAPRLPAEEVRRRGDILRRRRRAIQSATTAALAVVLVAFAVGINRDTRDLNVAVEPRPVVSVPGHFPLTHTYPEVTSPEQQLQGPGPDVPAFADLSACNRALGQAADPVDRLAARFSQPEDSRSRLLTVYGSTKDAVAYFDAIASIYRQCPREIVPNQPDTVNEIGAVGLGDDAIAIVRRGVGAGGDYRSGIEVIVMVRTGNAVLLSSVSNDGGATPASVEHARQTAEQDVAAVVAAMCVFANGSCTRG